MSTLDNMAALEAAEIEAELVKDILDLPEPKEELEESVRELADGPLARVPYNTEPEEQVYGVMDEDEEYWSNFWREQQEANMHLVNDIAPKGDPESDYEYYGDEPSLLDLINKLDEDLQLACDWINDIEDEVQEQGDMQFGLQTREIETMERLDELAEDIARQVSEIHENRREMSRQIAATGIMALGVGYLMSLLLAAIVMLRGDKR